jgi:hypothetical protein
MRLLILSTVLALLPGSLALGQEVFGDWMVFPGPNPEAEDLLPDADPENVFRIGQIIFENRPASELKIEHPIKKLADLPPVAEIVKSSDPSPSLVALARQQLSVPHRFDFERATVTDCGDAGLVWHVSYELSPKEGGSTGPPFRYRTLADGRGRIIPPELVVFDAFFHSANEGWSCSTLRLSTPPPKKDAALTEDKIRNLATKHLEAFIGSLPNDLPQALRKRMHYRNQQQVHIPFATDSMGAIVYYDLWAVNFVDSARKDRPNEVFTIWVAADGRLAKLRHLDIELNDDEQGAAPQRR